MDRPGQEHCAESFSDSTSEHIHLSVLNLETNDDSESDRLPLVSMEAEIPEVLYRGMKEFIRVNPRWDQYHLLSSAIAQFLVQNGCTDRSVTERYLDDLFMRTEV